MEECLSIWKDPDTIVTTCQSNIWGAEWQGGVERFAFFALLKSSWLLRSAFSVPSKAKMPMQKSNNFIKLSLSVIFLFSFTWILLKCNAKTTFYILRMQHVCCHSYFSSLSSTFGKTWFFWNLKLFECATQIANLFADNLGQVWSVCVAAVRILLE